MTSTPECDSGCRLAVKRFALGPVGRPLGDGGAGHPLGGGGVGPGARRGGDSDSDMALQRAVAGRVIRDAVLPTAPHDPAPATADGADRAGVVVPAGEGGGVQVLRPRVMVAAGVRERDERLAQALVARPAEAGCLAFARLDRDGGLAGVAGEGVAGGVAPTAVADLRQQFRGCDHAVWLLEQREEDRTVGVLADGGRDLPLELLDLLVDRLDRRYQAQDQRSADAELELADPGLGSAAELCQQPRGLLATGISLARQERLKALLAQTARVRGAGVALKERERDLTVQAREQPQRTGPETAQAQRAAG